MRFLVDAQLPLRLVRQLEASGHDARHTSGLADGNRTPDQVVAQLADAEDRVVVTKDGDFRDSHFLRATPRRLLIVATGNISNDALLRLFDDNLEAIVSALGEASFAELLPTQLVIHA